MSCSVSNFVLAMETFSAGPNVSDTSHSAFMDPTPSVAPAERPSKRKRPSGGRAVLLGLNHGAGTFITIRSVTDDGSARPMPRYTFNQLLECWNDDWPTFNPNSPSILLSVGTNPSHPIPGCYWDTIFKGTDKWESDKRNFSLNQVCAPFGSIKLA